jgi:methyltransferase (TIGR00027 family)
VTPNEPLIQHISDTALWVAVYRAWESDRPDAIFRDPLAHRLAGVRGEQIAAKMGFSKKNSWPFIARTWAFDDFISQQIRQGADTVINLAAGLDSRPYRMNLPPSLKWIEVDLAAMIDYKEEILAGEKPGCSVERFRVDLAVAGARRQLFEEIGRKAGKTLIVTEGLIVYLSPAEVDALARDLANISAFRTWAIDLASPGLLRRLKQTLGPHLRQSGAELQFAPPVGPDYFERHGWKTVKVYSMLHTAARLRRLPFPMRLLAFFPESKGRQGSRPWGGVCLYERA